MVQGDHNTVSITYDFRGAIVSPGQVPPVVQPAPTPVNLQPEAFTDLVDRTEVAGTLMQAMTSKSPAELSGPPGIGKSALLRYLCPRVDPKTFASGVVYVERRGRDADDLLQFIFQAFYDAPENFTAVGGRLLRYLQPLDALIVVDDANFDRDDLDHMRNTASRCTFVFARETAEMTDGKLVALSGLSEQDSIALVERRLGRVLTPNEGKAAHELWVTLAGNPLFLIQAAALVSTGHETIDDLESRLANGGPSDLAGAALATLTPQQRQLLSTLNGLGDAPVNQATLAAIAKQPDVAPSLKQMSELGVVQSHSPSFTAVANVKAVLGDTSAETIDRVLQWSAEAAAAKVEAAPVVQHAIQSAAQAGRWKDVITLVHHIEGVLASSGRWGAWKEVLGHALDAARKLGDVSEMGWALHQLGSRALALEDFDAAADLLAKALKARTGSGDLTGAEATRHNLTTLHSLSPDHAIPKNGHPGNGAGKSGIGGTPPWGLIVGLTAFAILATTGGVAIAFNPSLIGSLVNPAPSNPASSSPAVTPGLPALTIGKAVPSVLGQGGTAKIQLSGSGFEQGMTVDLGQGIRVVDVSVGSAVQVDVTGAAAPDAAPGKRDVLLTTQDGRRGTCAGCLTVSPAPFISAITPNIAGQGAVTRLTATSLYLTEKTQIAFSGTGVVVTKTFANITSKQLIGTLLVDPAASPGARDVTLTNPDAGTSTCAGCFTVTPAPVITAANPNTIYSSTTIQLTGSGLTPGTMVRFADTNIGVGSVKYESTGQITITVTVASGTQPGAKAFTVTNPDGGRSQCDACVTLSVIQ